MGYIIHYFQTFWKKKHHQGLQRTPTNFLSAQSGQHPKKKREVISHSERLEILLNIQLQCIEKPAWRSIRQIRWSLFFSAEVPSLPHPQNIQPYYTTPPKSNIDTKHDGFFQMYISFRIWLFLISTLNFRGVLIRKPTRLSHNQALLRPYFLWGGVGSIRGGTLRVFQCATERDFCWIIQRLYGTWNLTICEYSICRISRGLRGFFGYSICPLANFRIFYVLSHHISPT